MHIRHTLYRASRIERHHHRRDGGLFTHQLIEQAVLAVLAVVGGYVIFQSVYRISEDLVLALLAPVVAFLVIASLLGGDRGGQRHV